MASTVDPGRCKRCGQQPRSGGRAKCASCLAQAARGQRVLRERAKTNGLCIRCYQRLPEASVLVTCPACVVKHRRSHQAWARRLKREVLSHYGGARCVCCGEAGLAFLTVDHVRGNGAEHRRELGVTGFKFYRWLKKQDFPPGYQVLCMGCNWAKRRQQCCPHQLLREKARGQPEPYVPDWTI
jgi:hypothetical protein